MSKIWHWLVPEGEAKLRARAFLVLALVTLALHVPGELNIPAMDRDEARYAQATRQMFETGDFIDIKFADQDRFLQPIGIYWLQAAAAYPLGGAHAPIWAFRLPSLLAALGVVLLTAWFGARLFGPAVGLSAGLILAPSLLLTGEAHFAKIDASLCLATLIAQIALWMTITRSAEGKVRFIGWPLVFWLAIGAGGLLKGPIIALVVGLTVIAYGAWQREWRAFLRLNPILGVIIVVAMIAPWLVAIEMKTHGAFLQHAVGHSLGYKIAHGEQSHGQPPGYHAAIFMVTFFPGVVLAGLGGFQAWRNRSDQFIRFLLSWILPTWILFELVATKLPHYTLPVFPALALLGALGLREAPELLARAAGRWWHCIFGLLFVIAASALTALPIVAARTLSEPMTPAVIAASIFGVATIIAGAYLWWRPSPQRLLPLLAATALTYLCLLQFVVPGLKKLWVSDELARAATHLNGCTHMTVASAGYTEPSIVFHFGSDIVLGDGKSAADFLQAHPACGIAIVELRERQAFQAELQTNNVRVQSFASAAGVNFVNGKKIELTIYGTISSALDMERQGR